MISRCVRIRLVASLLLCVVLSSACSPAPDNAADTVVATFDGGQITCNELEGSAGGRRSGKADDEKRRIEAAAVNRGLARDAAAKGQLADPTFVAKMQRAEDGALATALRSRERSRASVSDDEVEAALEKERDHLRRPKQVQLKNIFKRAPTGATAGEREATQHETEALRARIMAGEDFEAVAKAESDSQTAARGGRMGVAKAGQLPPTIEAVAFALEEGEVSEVVELPDGFAFFTAENVTEAFTMDVEEARAIIRKRLTQQEGKRLVAELEEQLLEAASPTFDLDTLRRPDAPGDSAVVSWGKHSITAGEVRRLAGPIPEPISDGALSRLQGKLERQVTQILFAEHARELGLELDEAAAARLERRKTTILADAELERRISVALEAPTEGELRFFFDKKPQRFSQPPAFDLGVIRLGLGSDNSGETTKLARTLRRGLAAGDTTFEAAAAAHSDLPSARSGGRPGWLPGRTIRSRFGSDVLRAAQKLQPAELSQVVHDEGALWIITVHDRRDRREPTFEEAAPRIAQQWGAQRVRALEREIRQEVLEGLDLEIIGSCGGKDVKGTDEE